MPRPMSPGPRSDPGTCIKDFSQLSEVAKPLRVPDSTKTDLVDGLESRIKPELA